MRLQGKIWSFNIFSYVLPVSKMNTFEKAQLNFAFLSLIRISDLRSKILSFGTEKKMSFSFAFLSLIRIFAGMIFYFSGTGNTRWAAERLAECTGEQLYFIPEELNGDCRYELKADERIGFCFPVHGWQPPHIVRNFIRKMQLQNAAGHFCYALVTCGDSIGRTMEILNKELSGKGLKAMSLFSLVMPESYVCLPFMYTDTPEREWEKKKKAAEELEQYAAMIVGRKTEVVHTTRGLTPWTFSHVIGAYFNGHMITDRKFTVDTDTCIHCRRCEEVCPTGDVRLVDGVPVWQHDGTCTCCLACYHHCPKHAINYGNITRKRGQYYFNRKDR